VTVADVINRYVGRLRPPASMAARKCATCGVGLFPEEAGPFCVPHAPAEIDNRGTLADFWPAPAPAPRVPHDDICDDEDCQWCHHVRALPAVPPAPVGERLVPRRG
jgi:hypothetical protein